MEEVIPVWLLCISHMDTLYFPHGYLLFSLWILYNFPYGYFIFSLMFTLYLPHGYFIFSLWLLYIFLMVNLYFVYTY